MIQFNLLPDVKLEYIRTRRTKRFVNFLSFGVAGSLFVVMILLVLFVNVAQSKHLRDLNKDIKTSSDQLQGIKDLDKILTIQNQLSSLPVLHAQKPVTSRLFTYLSQVIPAQVGTQSLSVSKLEVDMTLKTVTITGEADSVNTVNKFVDTLKFTSFSLTDKSNQDTDPKAFSSVVSFISRDEKEAGYKITFSFDPVIFDITKDPKLTVPKIITTRSQTEKPNTSPFKPSTKEEDR